MRYYTRAQESNGNATKASYQVTALIVNHCKPLTEGEFILSPRVNLSNTVMTMVKNIYPEKEQEFVKVSLARNTVARRIEEVSSDIKKQLGVGGKEFDFFSQACNRSTDASDTAQLLNFFSRVDFKMNITEKLLDLHSLKNQTRERFILSCLQCRE